MAVKKRWLQSIEDSATQEKVTLPWSRGPRRTSSEAGQIRAEDAGDAASS